MRHILAPCLAVIVLTSNQPALAQSSFETQVRRCDELRREVDQARRQLDMQSARTDSGQQLEDTVVSAMRARGKSEAEIEQYRRIKNMQQNWGGTESNAKRQHAAAVERYQMQGCSTGGSSIYNYDVK